MHRCTSHIHTAHGSALSDKKLHLDQKKWLTAIILLKAAPWAVFPEENEGNLHRTYFADCHQKLNTRPRKCLGFASPASRFFFELRGLHFSVESAPPAKVKKDKNFMGNCFCCFFEKSEFID